jgi:hypothetical protein
MVYIKFYGSNGDMLSHGVLDDVILCAPHRWLCTILDVLYFWFEKVF